MIETFALGRGWAVVEHAGYIIRVTGSLATIITPAGKTVSVGLSTRLRPIPDNCRQVVQAAGKDPAEHRLLGAVVVPASIEGVWGELVAEERRAAATRAAKARRHDALYNEGCDDGYNPHRRRR
jgi:hypothetical protein